MLTRARRIVNPLDFKRVVRRGRRCAGKFIGIHLLSSSAPGPARFGFVVSKTIGGAVTRNAVKRRLRSVAQAIDLPDGTDVVVRAYPASTGATFTELSAEFSRLVVKASS